MSLVRTTALLALAWSGAATALSLAPGSFYSAGAGAVHQYDASGMVLDSLSFSPDEPRGLTIGPDGNLYVVVVSYEGPRLPWVAVLGRSGELLRTHPFTGWIQGNGSAGKITFAPNGSQFYVPALNGLYRFDVGGFGGSLLNTIGGFDIAVLPNGELLLAETYSVARLGADGTFISRFNNVSDPNQVLSGDPVLLRDLRGIAYSSFTDSVYITMWSNPHMILQIDSTSQVLTGVELFHYCSDIEILGDGNLLVGSWQQSPGRFSAALEHLGTLIGPNADFVTHFPAAIFQDGFEP